MTKDQLNKIMEIIAESCQEKNIEETSQAIGDTTKEIYGSVPFAIKILSQRPDVCIPSLIKSLSLYQGKEVLEPKISELIAISSAVANGCEFCMNVHMEKASSQGATREEIFHTILISSAICESSKWAVAFREFRKLQDKEKKCQYQPHPKAKGHAG